MGMRFMKKNDIVYVKRDGAVQAKIGYADICGKFHKVQLDKTRRRQLWAMLRKYRDVKCRQERTPGRGEAEIRHRPCFFGKSDNPLWIYDS